MRTSGRMVTCMVISAQWSSDGASAWDPIVLYLDSIPLMPLWNVL